MRTFLFVASQVVLATVWFVFGAVVSPQFVRYLSAAPIVRALDAPAPNCRLVLMLDRPHGSEPFDGNSATVERLEGPCHTLRTDNPNLYELPSVALVVVDHL